MDLIAYVQKADYEQLLKDNNIHIPRLRGVRCMSEEEHIPLEEYKQAHKDMIEWEAQRRRPKMRWAMLTGRKWRIGRYELRRSIEMRRRAVIQNLNTFNRFVGQPDVLCIHARIGGGNWEYYGGDKIAKQPWFICKVDDYFDDTYCDIYVRVKNG